MLGQWRRRAAVGGPNALVGTATRSRRRGRAGAQHEVDPAVLAERRARWSPLPALHERGDGEVRGMVSSGPRARYTSGAQLRSAQGANGTMTSAMRR